MKLASVYCLFPSFSSSLFRTAIPCDRASFSSDGLRIVGRAVQGFSNVSPVIYQYCSVSAYVMQQ